MHSQGKARCETQRGLQRESGGPCLSRAHPPTYSVGLLVHLHNRLLVYFDCMVVYFDSFLV